DRQLDILFQCDWLFIDGTFKIVPALFAQLVCIVGIFEGQVVTLCYALVDSKHTDVYRAIIRSLKEEAIKRGNVLNPNYVMTDFEVGLIKAISAEFPTTTHHVGCFFHHTQSVYRMISTLGLKTTYENVESVRDLCRKLMAVALLPIDDVEDGYLEVLNQLTLETFSDTHVFNLMNDLMNYYDREWLRVIGKDMYCVYNLDYRTNNNCEGMNNRISHKLVGAHPNVWKVLDMLVSEEFHTHQYVNQVITGRKRPSRATKEQKRYQKQLDNLYDLYGRKVIDLPTMLNNLLCKDALESLKFYKGRTYPTLPKNLDGIIKQWVNTVNCSIGGKVYYKKINDGGTRNYFVEQSKEKKLVLKVMIQSIENKKSKKSGVFEVLTCEQEFCHILNDFVKSLKDTGCSLEAASYHREMSKRFDVGRDRLSFVLKWLNQNLSINSNLNSTNDTSSDYCPREDSNFNVSHDEHISNDHDDDNDENNEDDSSSESSHDNTNHDASKSTLSASSTITSIETTRKRSNSHLTIRSPPQQNKKLNKTLENLSIWNNEAAAYKIMSPLNRRERRRGQKQSV
ncbi:unnamed protein product, partial [Rotaria sp. Silwood1]